MAAQHNQISRDGQAAQPIESIKPQDNEDFYKWFQRIMKQAEAQSIDSPA